MTQKSRLTRIALIARILTISQNRRNNKIQLLKVIPELSLGCEVHGCLECSTTRPWFEFHRFRTRKQKVRFF